MGHMNKLNLLIALLCGVHKRISHSHTSSNHNDLREYSRSIKHLISSGLIKFVSTDMLGCSNDANNWLYGFNWYKDKRIKIVNNGIDVEKFKNNKEIVRRQDLGLPDNKILLLHVGRICHLKNPMFIIEIINELSKIRQDVHLVYVGSGELEREVKIKVSNYKLNSFVSMLGARKDIPEIVNMSDYFLFPSIKEGLGISLVEAQAGGKICFISDTIPKEADLGLCVRISLKNNARDWANVINEYINKESKVTNKINTEKLEKFDIKNTTRILEEIYNTRC